MLITSMRSPPEAARSRHRVAQVHEAGLQAGIELPPRRGERNRAHAALEQFQPEQILEPADLVAQRAGGDVQLQRRLGEAQMPRRGLEGAQRIERGHRPMHEKISNVGRENILCQSER